MPERVHDATASMARLLVDAGIGPGMRVVNLGCGIGHVTRLLARLVGPDGSVLGVDRQPRALARAAEQARGDGLENVTFRQHDLSDPLPDPPFDAAVARRVLRAFPQTPARRPAPSRTPPSVSLSARKTFWYFCGFVP